ncbi:MAG: Ig-like domain-containing protein, partial [Bdellovibrionia bacterium]
MVVQRPLDRIFNLWALALTMLFVGCTKGVPSFESLGLNLPSPAVSGTTITVADKDEVITLNGSFDSRFYEIVIEAPELVSPRAFETSSFNTAASGEQDQYNFSISGPVSDWIDFDDKPAGYSETIKIYGQSKLGRSNESLITIIYNPAATAGPTVSLGTGAADPMNLAFTVNVTFTASVTGFDVSDVSLSAGAISNFLGSGSVYSFDVTPPVSGMGSVDVSIPALAAVDSGGNANSASLTLSRNYDWVPPAPTISLGAGSGNGLVGVSGFCENGLPVTLTDGFMIASTTCSGGGWSDTFSILGGDGLTSLTVSQTDGMGNSGSNAGVYNKDTTNPLPPGFPDDGIDYQSSTTTPSVNWGAGSDAGVGIAFYEVSVGSGLTGAAQTDVIAWMNVGNVTNVQLAALSLTIGNTYYFSVRAVDFLGLRSADVVSDGWLVVGPLDHFDVSTIDPATAGIVQGLFVVAKDAAGTTIRNYTGTVTFSSDDGAATLPGDYTFLAGDLGALNTSVRFTVAGTYYVRAQDTVGGEFGQQNNINILHAPAAQVVFTSEPVSAISGAGFAAVAVVQ